MIKNGNNSRWIARYSKKCYKMANRQMVINDKKMVRNIKNSNRKKEKNKNWQNSKKQE